MQLQNAATARTNRVWQFFALTYALTWIFWIPLALSGQDVMAGPLMIPLLLGGFGPSIAGIIMTYRTQDREGRRDFWRRSISFRQIGARWYAVVLLIFPAVYALAILLDMLLGGDLPGAEALVQSASQPAFLLVGVVMSLVMGPLSEEFGWRGFALDQLLSVQVVTISQVYDQFSHGLADPAAVRELLRYAHAKWAEPAPQYVLLVGEASYD